MFMEYLAVRNTLLYGIPCCSEYLAVRRAVWCYRYDNTNSTAYYWCVQCEVPICVKNVNVPSSWRLNSDFLGLIFCTWGHFKTQRYITSVNL